MNKIYKSLLNRIYNPFLIINLKPLTLELKESEKCLLIAPHPDDESIGCGGLLKLFPQNFEVVSLTHGDINDIRYQEMHNAMDFAGVKNFRMLNIKDKEIISGKKEFDDIDISSFDYVFIPYILDQHKDHKAVSILLSEKLKHSKYKNNLKIAYYEVWSTISMPQYCIDITKVIEDKKAMINFHKSQIKTRNYADKILGLNSYRGMLRGVGAVECFSILEVKDFQKIVSKVAFDI